MIAGAGGNATSDLTLADTTSATVDAIVTAVGGSAGVVNASDGGQIESGAGGDANATGNLTGTGQVFDQVEAFAGDGGATAGIGTAVTGARGGALANASASALGGMAETGHGAAANATATAVATGVADATATAEGGSGTTGSGTAAARAVATGASGTASANAAFNDEDSAGSFGSLNVMASAPVAGTATAVANVADGGTLTGFDTTDQAVANAVLDPAAGAGGLIAGAGGALLVDTEQGGGNLAAVAGSVTISSDMSATLDLSGYAPDNELELSLAGSTLVGAGVTGVTLLAGVGSERIFEQFASGAAAVAYFSSNLLDLGTIADDTTLPARTGFNIDLTVTVDASGSGFYADPLFAEGAVQTAPPCFASGTRIATNRGDVPAEDLRIGDQVATLTGSTPVVWVGRRRVHCGHHPAPETVNPVRIRAHAWGDTPVRDLWLSPDHAVWFDGALVPALLLADGDAIKQEARDIVTYVHVELERHDVIFAEGLAVESYLDTGNRSQFANAPLVDLHPAFGRRNAVREPCAPMVLDGPRLEAIRDHLRVVRRRAARRAGVTHTRLAQSRHQAFRFQQNA